MADAPPEQAGDGAFPRGPGEAPEDQAVVLDQLAPGRGTREIGNLAVWTVTSAKPGNGVEMLRDKREDTYWQSDGTQPHFVNIQFQRKVQVTEVAVYVDYKLDESYTPSKLSIRAGTSFHDLREIRILDLKEASGWVMIPLIPPDHPGPLKAFFIQLAVLNNHQNGRDTHLRQVNIYGPQQTGMRKADNQIGFSTVQFSQFATVR